MNTLERVKAELRSRRGEWPEIARLSGVPYFTIAKISQGVTENPRWRTVEALQDVLLKKPEAA